MSVVIRLARGGRKKMPYYAIVVANSRAARDGRFIEKVGTYNPMLPREDANRIRLVTERIQHWLSVGAQPTDRVALFLANAGLIKARARTDQTKQDKPRAKAQERMKEEAAKLEAAREAEEAKKREAEEAAAAAKEAAAAAPAPEPEPAAEEAPAEVAAAADTTEEQVAGEAPAEAPAEENTAA